jgi:deoxyribodipyrimidine photo-lyase
LVVDTHNIIPAWVVSDKQEFAAHTMRRKVHKYLEHYVKDPSTVKKHAYTNTSEPDGITFDQAYDFIQDIPANGTSIAHASGEKAGLKHLQSFIEKGLDTYAIDRNDPSKDRISNLSPYLHYGQVSSLRIALAMIIRLDVRPLLFEEARLIPASTAPSDIDGMNALLEEMVVRKELSDNYCLHNPQYLSIKGGPEWGQKTLDEHRDDPREFSYTREEWEAAKTHDDSWNAAQKQLMKTGKMHGYMRMYWAKKMLEWSATPEQALSDCIYLNDKYSIDGGDPNGFVGMLWSMTGLHDRPWTQRSVFGQVRYMNDGGLIRKFDIKQYQADWL